MWDAHERKTIKFEIYECRAKVCQEEFMIEEV